MLFSVLFIEEWHLLKPNSVIPAKAGIQKGWCNSWIPAFAGMTIVKVLFIFSHFILK